MYHGNYYMPFFMSFFNISVSFNDLLQLICPVNYCFQFFIFNEIFE